MGPWSLPDAGIFAWLQNSMENDSVLMVLALSVKFLSQRLLLQHFSELRDVGWQEISSLNRIFNFGVMRRYADKEPPWRLRGEEAWLKLQASSAAATTDLARNVQLLGERGGGNYTGSAKSFFLFNWDFSCGCYVVGGNCCTSALRFLSFPPALVSPCCAYLHWWGTSTSSTTSQGDL